jgi:type II secretory pathway component GspD/PulD (secretin)
MKTKILNWQKILGGVLILFFCAAIEVQAQNRAGGGGGGGGFGGFGGFGGGGGGNRAGGGGGNSSSSGSAQYNYNGQVGGANISVDPDTHSIVVVADEETMEQISNVLRNLDTPKPQVLIKAVFLEVQDSKASAIGAQANYTGFNNSFGKVTGFLTNSFIQENNTTVANGGTTTSTTFTPVPTPYYQSYNVGNDFGLPQALAGAAGNGGVYQLIGNDFTATIQALATAGKSQVLSRPSVLARDGQLAEIVVGSSIYLPSSVSLNRKSRPLTLRRPAR